MMKGVGKKSSRGVFRVDIAFFTLVVILLVVLVITVHWSGYYLLSQTWNNLADFKEAYKLVIVDTFVGPFEALLAAFVVYAFGKHGAKVLDNKTRAKLGKPLHDMSFFGKVPDK